MIRAIAVFGAIIASIILQLWALVGGDAPELARCPAGLYVEGVRPNGLSTCVQPPPQGCDEPAGTATEMRPCVFELRRAPIRVHCTGGSHPIVIDAFTIGCQR
jgi:hypothetical protein